MSERQERPSDAIKTTIDQEVGRIRAALADRKLSVVAQATGLHENTVRNIAKGRGGNPTLTTIEKLTAYLFA